MNPHRGNRNPAEVALSLGLSFSLLLGALFFGIGLADSAQAWASGEAKINGRATFTGNGCLGNTAQAAISPDSSALSVLFGAFQAEAGKTTGTSTDRKTCVIHVPVKAAPGYRIAITGVQYRGFVSLPERGHAMLTVDYAFSGPGIRNRNPRIYSRFTGPYDRDFDHSNRLRMTDVQWSSCGAQLMLDASASMVAVTNERKEQAIAGIDSFDLGAGLNLQIQHQPCRP